MKTTEGIPNGKRSKWPAEAEPLPGAARRATSLPAQTQPAASESQEHTQPPPETEKAPAETDPEACRIAGELVKLHRDGAIKSASDPDAEFYAHLIKRFSASFTASVGAHVPEPGKPYVPTAAQRVKVPRGLSRKQEADFLARDLREAFSD